MARSMPAGVCVGGGPESSAERRIRLALRPVGLEAEDDAVGVQSGVEQQVVPERGFTQGIVPGEAPHVAVQLETLAELLEPESAFPVAQQRRRGPESREKLAVGMSENSLAVW